MEKSIKIELLHAVNGRQDIKTELTNMDLIEVLGVLDYMRTVTIAKMMEKPKKIKTIKPQP